MSDTPLNLGIFSRLKVIQRISIGFLVILLLVAFLGVQFVRSVDKIDNNVNQVMATSQDAMISAKLATSIEKLDRMILTYIVGGTKDELEEAKVELENFQQSLQSLMELAERGKVSAEVEVIQQAAADYQDAFERIDPAVIKRTVGQRAVSEAGRNLSTKASAILERATSREGTDVQRKALGMLNALQASRVAISRYLFTGNPSDSDVAVEEFKKFETTQQEIAKSATDKRIARWLKSFGKDLDKYSSELNNIISGSKAIELAQEDNRTALKNILDAVAKIVATFETVQNEVQTEATEVVDSGRRQAVIMPAIAIAFGILFSVLIGLSIASPIRRLTAAMVALADGQTSVKIPATRRHDEVGNMARAVQVFKDNALEMENLRSAKEQERIRAEEEKHRAMNDLALNFESTVMGVVQSVVQESGAVQSNAEIVDDISQQTREHATQGAAATEEASVNVNLVAAAVEQLTGSVASISSQVDESVKIAGAAVDEARQADHVVNSLIEAAERIGAVVHLIQKIASQTNLLALNATIEAARAGDAGKGFAVVANEVGGLAKQTSSATEDIGVQVEAIQGATQDAVSAIRHIVSTITRMNDIAGEISSSIDQQVEATREIRESLHSAAIGTTEVAGTISDVMHKVTNSSSAADRLLASAATLSQQTSILKNEVNAFTGRIRSA